MSPEQIVEATLFASQTPLTAAELARADDALTVSRVEEALSSLREHYELDERSFQVYQLGDGYQLLTRPEFAPYLERFDSVPRTPTLSRAALETLAIIAYRQPIGRIEIEEIRGVAATSVLRTLQDWELIEVVARGEGLGRPLLYGTTKSFMDHFGLRALEELPRPEELPVALGGVDRTDLGPLSDDEPDRERAGVPEEAAQDATALDDTAARSNGGMPAPEAGG